LAGVCDPLFSCAYVNTLCWQGPTTPLPMVNDPRVVFERLFGDTGSTDPVVRQRRIRKTAVCSTRSWKKSCAFSVASDHVTARR